MRDLLFKINAEKIKAKIANRSFGAKCFLWTIRCFTLIINLGVIFGGFVAIIWT